MFAFDRGLIVEPHAVPQHSLAELDGRGGH